MSLTSYASARMTCGMRRKDWCVIDCVPSATYVYPRCASPIQGPERIKSLYAFRSILDFGGRITLGSDMPVEGVNPLAGFYAAITRLTEEGTSPHGPEGWCVNFAPASGVILHAGIPSSLTCVLSCDRHSGSLNSECPAWKL